MTYGSPVAERWLGLCPKQPGRCTAPVACRVPEEPAHAGQPEGKGLGPAPVFRGFCIALSGTRTLLRHRSLFWFPFVTGLVLAGLFTTQYGIRLLSVYPYDAIDLPRWIVLTFVADLIAVLVLTTLLAGLVLGLSEGESGRPVPVREALVRTRQYRCALAGWSVILALAGTATCVLLAFSGYAYYSLVPVLRQFPFNFILLPEHYGTGPMGGTYAMSSAVSWTLALSGINALLFIATLFVVPLVVLEKKALYGAVTGSVTRMKKVPGEAAGCFLLLLLVVGIAAASSRLFGIVYGMVEPARLLSWNPGEAWIAAATLFLIAFCSLACIASTVAGIAVADLYRRSSDRELPGEVPDDNGTAPVPAGEPVIAKLP